MSKTFPNKFNKHFLIVLWSAITLSHLRQGSRHTLYNGRNHEKGNPQTMNYCFICVLDTLTQQKLFKSNDLCFSVLGEHNVEYT